MLRGDSEKKLKAEHARAGAAWVGGNAARVAGGSRGSASDQRLGCKHRWYRAAEKKCEAEPQDEETTKLKR
ncbi:MAG: hypothetical protein QOE96_3070 [Blastocatellia bacterium]|nr:hypothetical protein [Blastocatellia bacterium]